jgi:integrase
MPRGACVIPYRGKRGVVWRIKYADADGKQVMETLGPEREGWNAKRANEELQNRLADVRRIQLRKPTKITFSEYADTWFAEGKTRRRWRHRTVIQYRSIAKRLKEEFGPMPLATIRPRHVAAYIGKQTADFEPSTVGRDVDLLHDILKTAKREELVRTNPVEGAERPKMGRRRWRILSATEISRVKNAFTDEDARTVFLTLVLTGIRRGELQALRWRDVDLVENAMRVSDSKTEEGIRSIALSSALAEALWQHRRRSNFQGDDELVFCHPERGTVYREDVFAEKFRAALGAAGITDHVRPFHDLRHTSLTHEAAAGSGPTALMAKAGHTDMRVTRRYLHLAGIVFHEEAEALERRLGLGGEVSTQLSTHLSESELVSENVNRSAKRLPASPDAAA